MDGQGEYGRGRDDHGNDDDHDEDHIDDQDNAAFVGPYGGYGDGTYWHGLGYDHGRGGGRGGYDNDCRTKENWRFSANGEGCRSRLYRTKCYPEVERDFCYKMSEDAHISKLCLFQKTEYSGVGGLSKPVEINKGTDEIRLIECSTEVEGLNN